MTEVDPSGYGQLGLSRNPFVAEEEPGVTRELWLDRGLPDAPSLTAGSFVQVVGPKGAGKTSHLLRWRASEPGPYRHVDPGWRRARPLPVAALVYWDEVDRVPSPLLRLALAGVARLGGAIRCGTHRDLSAEAARAGLDVTTFVLPLLEPAAILAWSALRVRAVTRAGCEPRWCLDARDAAHIAAASVGWRDVATALHVSVARAARAEAQLTSASSPDWTLQRSA